MNLRRSEASYLMALERGWARVYPGHGGLVVRMQRRGLVAWEIGRGWFATELGRAALDQWRRRPRPATT